LKQERCTNMNSKLFSKAKKLDNVCYEIRGEVMETAKQMESDGYQIHKFNIGNPAPFGFDAPHEIIQDVIRNMRNAQGYCDSQGLFSARKAIMQDCQLRQLMTIEVDDIYMGNGVSELISLTTQTLLNPGDEVLIPAPDYPLWTAAVSLAGGTPIHYQCDESNNWQPNLEDIDSKINTNTRAIVVINPNNPTGAVYSQETLTGLAKLAEQYQLVIFADEIYDRITYAQAKHIPMASLVKNSLCITFNGLSKSYRLAGFRSGWAIISGNKNSAKDYIEGLNIMSSMRLCANVPGQFAVQTSLGGYQSINDLVLPQGRMYEQMQYAHARATAIEGITCVKPQGALYIFPRLDPERYPIENDETFVLDFLKQQQCLVVQGTGFNLSSHDHIRIVTLPHIDQLALLFDRLEEFLAFRFPK